MLGKADFSFGENRSFYSPALLNSYNLMTNSAPTSCNRKRVNGIPLPLWNPFLMVALYSNILKG